MKDFKHKRFFAVMFLAAVQLKTKFGQEIREKGRELIVNG